MIQQRQETALRLLDKGDYELNGKVYRHIMKICFDSH